MSIPDFEETAQILAKQGFLLVPARIKQLWLEQEHRLGFTGVRIEDYSEEDLPYDMSIAQAELRLIVEWLEKISSEKDRLTRKGSWRIFCLTEQEARALRRAAGIQP